MKTTPPTGRHSFDDPAVYQIRIEGRLETSWSARLEGMAITIFRADDGLFVTTLEGELTDQAALAGVLTKLYAMQLPVLSVQRL